MRWLFLLIVVLVLAGCGGSDKPVMFTGTLTCADCMAAGMPANVWKTAYESSLACKLGWGDIVDVTDSLNGRYEIHGVGCDGWIGHQLVLRN